MPNKLLRNVVENNFSVMPLKEQIIPSLYTAFMIRTWRANFTIDYLDSPHSLKSNLGGG